MTKLVPFIERFGLWTPDQKRQVAAMKARAVKDKLKLIRLAWSDTHGHARTKEVTVPAFLSALTNGYNINVATTTLDASGARTFASFTPVLSASGKLRKVVPARLSSVSQPTCLAQRARVARSMPAVL